MVPLARELGFAYLRGPTEKLSGIVASVVIPAQMYLCLPGWCFTVMRPRGLLTNSWSSCTLAALEMRKFVSEKLAIQCFYL